MRDFRYGGVNVTYFLPKSLFQINQTSDRLSLPSVRLFLSFSNSSYHIYIYYSLKRKP